MEKITKIPKINISKHTILINLLFVGFSLIVVSQNSAFLFNPFILVLLCSSYSISFTTLLISSFSIVVGGYLINSNYGQELILVTVLAIALFFFTKLFHDKKIEKYGGAILLNLLVMIAYFFSSKVEFSAINSLISCFVGLIISIYTIVLINKIREKEKTENLEIAVLIGFITTLFYFLDSFSFIWLILISLISLRLFRIEAYFMSLAVSFLLFNLFANSSLNILFSIYSSLVILGLIKTKYSYFFFIPIISFLFFIINKTFYLDQIYHQVIIGFLLMTLFPYKILVSLRRLINYDAKEDVKEVVEYQTNKFKQLNKLCDLLMDDRFDKYDKLDIQMEKTIKKEVCFKCSNKNTCNLDIKRFLTGYLSNNDKNDINASCIYPFQLMKTINNANKRIVDYSERELRSVESKKIMNNSYQIIKKYLDIKPIIHQGYHKYQLEYEVISTRAEDSPNGDSYKIYELGKYQFCSLSDGMGHTSKSKDISEYLLELLEYLLRISNSIEDALEASNQILLAKTYEEVYATLDLSQFNLETGEMKIYKLGSYPTYIIRNRTIKEIRTKLPPVGIINNLKAYEEKFELMNNDIVLFLTDGYGDDIVKIIEKTVQKASFLPLKNYIKFLNRVFIENKTIEDDQTIIGIKIKKN